MRAAQRLGLVSVRSFGRLMPLLLGWVQSPDTMVQIEALRTLAVVVRASWPRMTAHAPSLWRQLDDAYALAAHEVPQQTQVQSFADTGRLLYWCCSDAMQGNLRDSRSDSAFAQAVLAGV